MVRMSISRGVALACALVLSAALVAPAAALPGASASGLRVLAGGDPSGAARDLAIQPGPVGYDAAGNLYASDPGSRVVWRIAPDGTARVHAGSGRNCPLEGCVGGNGDGGPARDALLGEVTAMAVAADGSVYLAEVDTRRVRRVDATTGIIRTVAGDGTSDYDYSEEGAAATQASLTRPLGLALDSAGGFYIADSWGMRVRHVNAAGIIRTVAGCGMERAWDCMGFAAEGQQIEGTYIGAPHTIAVDAADRLHVVYHNVVFRVDEKAQVFRLVAGDPAANAESPGEGEGGPASGARFRGLAAAAFAPDGSLVLVDAHFQRVQRVAAPVGPASTVTHVAGCDCGTGWQAITPAFSGDGKDARLARFAFTDVSGSARTGVAISPADDVALGDQGNNRVRLIGAGVVRTVAGTGDGGAQGRVAPERAFASGSYHGGVAAQGIPAAQAQAYPILDVEVDAAGRALYLDGAARRVQRIEPDGRLTTVAGGGCVGGISCDPPTIPYGDGGPATAARLDGVATMTLDRDRAQLYLVQPGERKIRQVNLGTAAVTVYPSSSAPITIAPGHIATVFGVGENCNVLAPYCGDGGPATGARAALLGGVAVDGGGNLFVTDYTLRQVRRVDGATGVVSLLAGVQTVGDCDRSFTGPIPAAIARLCGPLDVAVSADGQTVYIAESLGSTLGGLNATFGPMTAPRILVLDRSSNLIRRFAGSGTPGYGGDGGPALGAHLAYPHSLMLATDGSLVFADTANSRIRRISSTGVITTLVGQGELVEDRSSGYSRWILEGCGRSAAGTPVGEALLCAPLAVAQAPNGGYIVADTLNNRVVAIP